jgi:hypothetical protein
VQIYIIKINKKSFYSGKDENGNPVELKKQTEPGFGFGYGINMILFSGVYENELRNFINFQFDYGILISISDQSDIPLSGNFKSESAFLRNLLI